MNSYCLLAPGAAFAIFDCEFGRFLTACTLDASYFVIPHTELVYIHADNVEEEEAKF